MKYGVFNPLNGETTLLDSKEEAMQLFWIRMIQLTLPHFHNTPYMTIIKNEDGSETWKNINDQEIDKPLSYEELSNLYLRSINNT